MPDNHQHSTAADPFTRFWSDMMSQMPGMGATGVGATRASGSDEAAKQMQRMFFDAMAKYCDDFLRSEQFLTAMKQMMDRSIAFKQQVDQFLTKAMHGMQAPARADMEDITGVLRSVEERVLSRLEKLEAQVAQSKVGGGKKSAATGMKKSTRKPGRKK